MIEYKVHYRHWKFILASFSDISMKELKRHANTFFKKVNTIRPHKIPILNFIRHKPLEFFKQLTFKDDSSKQNSGNKKSYKVNPLCFFHILPNEVKISIIAL